MADVEWSVAGERLHWITGRTRGGNLVETRCGLRIYLSALDRHIADPSPCVPCRALAQRRNRRAAT